MATTTPNLNADTPAGANAMAEAISYYLNLRLMAKAHNTEVKIPLQVAQIIEFASELPPPELVSWGALASGNIPKDAKKSKKSKPKATTATGAGDEEGHEGGEGTAKKTRGKWTDEHKAELVRMVEDESFREAQLGTDANFGGHPNYGVLAKRYGFSTAAPIKRMYTTLTGKEAPGAKPKAAAKREVEVEGDKAEVGQGGGATKPAPKKAKTEPKKAAGGAAKDNDNTFEGKELPKGWNTEAASKLVKLVENEDFRKSLTGKRSLKWSRIVECFSAQINGLSKKDCKRLYTTLTGKETED